MTRARSHKRVVSVVAFALLLAFAILVRFMV